MTKRVVLTMAVILAIFAVAASAADVAGKWTAERPGRDGQPQKSTFTFVVDGNKLTGTVASTRGEAEITDGKIKGDSISFNVVLKMQDREIKMNYKGKMSGDEIKFNMSIEGMDREMPSFVAKRAQ